MTRLFAFVVLCSFAIKAAAQTPLFSPETVSQLNSSLAALMKKENLPSLEVSIKVPGRGSYQFVQGSADLKTNVPRQPNQQFRIASITKPFAALAILKLVDSGQLKTEDTLAKWFPDFPNASLITIDDLLKMRSGIPAPDDDAVLAKVYDAPLAQAPSFEKEMSSYSSLWAQFKKPNTAGVYTDFNYDILAAIAQKITGQDIGALITRSVISPLQLKKTLYPTGTGVPGGLHGYGWNPTKKIFEDKTLFNPPLAGAAGAVISSAEDLHVFARALCQGTLLKPTTFHYQMDAKLLAGSSTSYGAGVALGSGVCGHSGTINGFSSDMYYFEKLNATLVISVTRLDRDNRSRSTSVLELVSHTMLSSLSPSRSKK